MSNYSGAIHRTAEPLGGTIAYDIAGTLRGIWFNPTQPTYPEGPHLAFVPDPIDPTQLTVSMGTSQPGFRQDSISSRRSPPGL